MTVQPEALRLADSADACQITIHDCALISTELRRLHTENETLRTQHVDAHKCTSAIFGALTQISILTDLGGEVAEYEDVVQAVRRLHQVNQELLEALMHIEGAAMDISCERRTIRDAARAAISKATGEAK